MIQIRLMLLASSIALPGAALGAPDQAQPATGMASEHRLSPAEIEAVLNDAASKRQLAEPSDERLPPPIQGEIGFSIGTGGYRSAYGTAVVPLPGDGVAILSLGTDRFDFGRENHHRDR
jgi:hypothetical protein